MMTKLLMKSGVEVYTELSANEVRHYLQGGSKSGTIDGYTDLAKTTSVYIAAHAIVLVYK
jgi:hypothetical protein